MPGQAGPLLSSYHSSGISALVGHLLASALGLLWVLAARGLQGPGKDIASPKQYLFTLPLIPREDTE